MVLDECPKLTKDKKILSKAIKFQLHGLKDVKLNLEMINLKHYLVLLKEVYIKILELKVLKN